MSTNEIPRSALVSLADGGTARSSAVCDDIRRLVGTGEVGQAWQLLDWCGKVAMVEGGWVGDSRAAAWRVHGAAREAYRSACRPVDVVEGAS